MIEYKPGDIVNDHVFTGSAWVPISKQPQPPTEPPANPYAGMVWNGSKWTTVDPTTGKVTVVKATWWSQQPWWTKTLISLLVLVVVVSFSFWYLWSTNRGFRIDMYDLCAKFQPLNNALHCSTNLLNERYG